MNQFRLVFFVLFALLLADRQLSAHAVGQSYIFVEVHEQSIGGRFDLAFKDLNKALGLTFKTDGSVTRDEVAPHIERIKSYILKNVVISAKEGPKKIELGEYELYAVSFAQYVSVHFSLDPFPERPEYIDIEYSLIFDVDPEHRCLLAIEDNFETGTFQNEAIVALTFSPEARKKRLDLSAGSVWIGFLSLTDFGIHHIWGGIDHILFLLALLLPAVLERKRGDASKSDHLDRKWQPIGEFRPALINVVKIVTLFTIAHSVTLSLAALRVIELPSRLVESIIAVSIAFAAADIIYPVFRGHVGWIVLGFGVFHGFGFASVLSEMGIPPGKYMALSLLGFNVGVEIGQVAIVCVAFPLLFLVRRWSLYSRYLVHLGAACLIFISLYWFTERAFEVDLPLGSIVNKILGR